MKVVLVGDPHQLPEHDAGGLFRALTTRLPAIEPSDNRRQTHVWEQAALDELRRGEADAALATYRQHGRIRTADTAQRLRADLNHRARATVSQIDPPPERSRRSTNAACSSVCRPATSTPDTSPVGTR